MSQKLIKRFGRTCRACGVRKRSVISRPFTHRTGKPGRTDRGRDWLLLGTIKDFTLLCDECAGDTTVLLAL